MLNTILAGITYAASAVASIPTTLYDTTVTAITYAPAAIVSAPFAVADTAKTLGSIPANILTTPVRVNSLRTCTYYQDISADRRVGKYTLITDTTGKSLKVLSHITPPDCLEITNPQKSTTTLDRDYLPSYYEINN